MKTIIIKYSVILVVVEFITWWVLFYSPLNIPTRIPKTPINISGLLLLLTLTIIIFFLQKESLKRRKRMTFVRLIAISGLVIFLAELIFQTIRFPSLVADTLVEKLYFAGRALVVITLIGIVISIVIGIILKKRIQLVEG